MKIIYSPVEAAVLFTEWIKTRKRGKCTVCDLPTHNRLINQETGRLDYVHDYHEPEYIGCKEVWRYWQDRPHKIDRKEAERRAARGDVVMEELLSFGGEDDFLDERDYYTPGNYHEYIQSREWKIKATAVKRSVYFKCEKCGYRADYGDTAALHAHHLTYKRLFKEQRQDIQILCATCHQKETDRQKKRRGKR